MYDRSFEWMDDENRANWRILFGDDVEEDEDELKDEDCMSLFGRKVIMFGTS